MKNATLIISLFIFLAQSAVGQVIDFSTPVDIQFDGQDLEQVLTQLEKDYQIQFSYSRDLIPLRQAIYADLKQVQCKDALNKLFEQTQIVYGVIGNQIVLAIDTQKVAIIPDQQGQINDHPEESWASLETSYATRETYVYRALPKLKPDHQRLATQNLGQRYLIDIHPESHTAIDQTIYFDQLEQSEDQTIVHFSIFSPLGYRTSNDMDGPTNFGIHLLWGLEPKLDGIGLAGIGQSVKGDADGVQFSGVFNTVQGNTRGGQFSGVANVNLNQTRGASFAGVANYSRELSGGQFAGVMNVATAEAGGLQAAGVINVATKGQHISQLAGVSNIAINKSDFQAAGVMNIGGHVTRGQIAGVLNVARKVDGFQIGLFNFADTVKGPAIGLLSIVKSGYHSLGFSAQESLHSNAMVRLGTRSFYNILRVGARVDERTWALGYGIGSSIRIGKRNYLQLELISSHVNEREFWTNRLNLLNQFNLIANIKFGKHFGIAIGPTFNVSVSELYQADTDTYGMDLGSNYLFNRTSYKSWRNPINVRGWVGLNVGIRFDSR